MKSLGTPGGKARVASAGSGTGYGYRPSGLSREVFEPLLSGSSSSSSQEKDQVKVPQPQHAEEASDFDDDVSTTTTTTTTPNSTFSTPTALFQHHNIHHHPDSAAQETPTAFLSSYDPATSMSPMTPYNPSLLNLRGIYDDTPAAAAGGAGVVGAPGQRTCPPKQSGRGLFDEGEAMGMGLGMGGEVRKLKLGKGKGKVDDSKGRRQTMGFGRL